jgi:hypothetical protein
VEFTFSDSGSNTSQEGLINDVSNDNTFHGNDPGNSRLHPNNRSYEFYELKPPLKSEMLEVTESINAYLRQDKDDEHSTEVLQCQSRKLIERFHKKVDAYEKTCSPRYSSPLWIWFKKIKFGAKCLICDKDISSQKAETRKLAIHIKRYHGPETDYDARSVWERLMCKKKRLSNDNVANILKEFFETHNPKLPPLPSSISTMSFCNLKAIWTPAMRIVMRYIP